MIIRQRGVVNLELTNLSEVILMVYMEENHGEALKIPISRLLP